MEGILLLLLAVGLLMATATRSSLVVLAVVGAFGTLLGACATTPEPGDGERGAAELASEDVDDGEGDVGELEQGAAPCAVTCSLRMSNGSTWVYYCSGMCNGNSFYATWPYNRGRSFCYSRHAC